MRWFAFLGLAACAAVLLACGSQAKLTGTSLQDRPAPDFHLRDASGHAVSLDQFRGKAVVLTFLYTHCQDTCPLTAELIRHADEAAGHPKNVEFLAVSVDPVGDTPASVDAFDAEHHLNELGNRWHYLIGTRQELEPVWQSYFLFVPPELNPTTADHTAAIYFIDPHGRMRSLEGIDISAETLARDALLLAKQ